MILKLVRKILRFFILAFDRSFTPKPEITRNPEEQKKLDSRLSEWSLYHLEACPFCVKVRRHLKRRGLTLTLKEINGDPRNHEELMAGGKMDQVPCLRYRDETGAEHWMYESSAINAFLTTL
jgi:glutaredoxin